MFRRFHPLLGVLLIIGVIGALVSLTQRYRAEAAARSVALVLDYGQLRTLLTATGKPLDQGLLRFKAEDITGIALTEETLGDLQTNGTLRVRETAAGGAREYTVTIDDPAIAARVLDYVRHLARGAGDAPPPGDRVVLTGPGGGRVYVAGRFEDLRLTPVGIDPRAVEQVHAAGLEAVGRLNNPLGLTSESLRWDLRRSRDLGMTTLIFGGEEVLGFKGLVKETADTFRELGLIYGSIELGKQRGDDQLSKLLQDRLVRVHSISAAEMPRLTPPEAIERYVRAVAERNIRLEYVRLPGVVDENTFDDSVDYVHRLARGVAAAGFGISAAVPLRPVWPNPAAGRLAHAAIALGIAAGCVMLIAGIFPVRPRQQAVLALVAALGAVLLSQVSFHGYLGPQLLALAAAVAYPALGFILLPQPLAAFEDHRHAAVRERSEAVVPAVAEFAALCAVTLCGAIMVGGLLSELPFMIKVESFAGIKAATVLPILLVGWVYLTGMSGEYPSWGQEREAMRQRLQQFFSEPLRVWHTVALIVGLTALALLVARSGNDPGIGVSDTELRFRALLDRWLGARPRTKEFLIGHPALLLSLAMAALPRWRTWAFPLLLLGMIGQVGMLNSFCHLHTPLKLTVLHTVHGLWIGGLLGVILILLWNRLTPGERLSPEHRPYAARVRA